MFKTKFYLWRFWLEELPELVWLLWWPDVDRLWCRGSWELRVSPGISLSLSCGWWLDVESLFPSWLSEWCWWGSPWLLWWEWIWCDVAEDERDETSVLLLKGRTWKIVETQLVVPINFNDHVTSHSHFPFCLCKYPEWTLSFGGFRGDNMTKRNLKL